MKEEENEYKKKVGADSEKIGRAALSRKNGRARVKFAADCPSVSEMGFGAGRANVVRGICILLLCAGGFSDSVQSSLAGCGGWEEFALSDSRIEYHLRESGFEPQAGDIVLYDRVFINREHDHIGIVLENHPGFLITAEGNVGNSNASSIAVREKDSHIRAFIRLPDNYRYK